MRIRTVVPALVGALALGGLAAPAASAATNTAPKITKVSASSLVFSPSVTKTWKVSVTVTDNSGIKGVRLLPWPKLGEQVGFVPKAADLKTDGAPATCKATSSTTSVCTYAEQVNSHSDLGDNTVAGAWYLAVQVTGKDGGKTFAAKAASFSFKRQTALTATASAKSVKKNGTLTVSGLLRVADWKSGKAVGYGKKSVKLQFRKSGATAWTTVKTVTSDSKGAVKTTAKVTAAGSWRYVYAGSGTVASVNSAAATVTLKK
ncbi:DUF5707 domain-containing protein [Streptomyces sp. NPDC092296]|uniref:DUF5707 domain-containing protein n=1 Tax=Streptomyces sp. NPDC092296 TaxID=3366012 RepID=UPI00382706A0